MNSKQWAEIIENAGPNEHLEVPVADVYIDNKDDFMAAGLIPSVFNVLFPIVEQQMWSVLALWTLARSTPEGATLLEIGSGRGGSLATMGLANRRANLINIDRFEKYEEETNGGTGRNEFGHEEFRKNIGHLDLNFRTIRKWSDEAVNDIDDKSCDLIFIDGNHGYEHCKRDIENYSPKLKSRGILCGHDYHPRFPGVIRAVKECLKDYHVAKRSSVWFRTEEWMEADGASQ